MAFADVTTISGDEDNDNYDFNVPPLVNWHTCLEMDSPNKRWSEANNGTPRATEDQGYFQNGSEEVNIPHA